MMNNIKIIDSDLIKYSINNGLGQVKGLKCFGKNPRWD